MRHKTILEYLQGRDDQGLFAAARQAREDTFGRDVYLRGIVEFSNFCCKKCLYCGLRAPNTRTQRYRLPPERVVEAACLAPELELGTVVLQSGDDYTYSTDTIRAMVEEIKRRCDVAVTLSLGDRPLEELARFRQSGADRYLIKLETCDPDLYGRMRPGETLERRLELLEHLRGLGFEIGSGIIVGLPGMSLEMLASDILRLAELDLDMIAVGPFVPHPRTPLADAPPGCLEQSLRAAALLRLLCPGSNIPATSALNARPGMPVASDASAPEDGRALGLRAGCNVIMPSLTPEDVRGAYEIYPGKNAFTASARQSVERVRELIRQEGLLPSPALGFARKSVYSETTFQAFAPDVCGSASLT